MLIPSGSCGRACTISQASIAGLDRAGFAAPCTSLVGDAPGDPEIRLVSERRRGVVGNAGGWVTRIQLT